MKQYGFVNSDMDSTCNHDDDDDDDNLSRISFLSPARRRTTATSSSVDSCKKSDEKKPLRLNIPLPTEFMGRQDSNRSTASFISDVSSLMDEDESEDDVKVESEDEDYQRSNWPYPEVIFVCLRFFFFSSISIDSNQIIRYHLEQVQNMRIIYLKTTKENDEENENKSRNKRLLK